MFSAMMDNVKDVLLVSNLTKATEMALQASSQLVGGFASPAAAATKGIKRKIEKVAQKKVKS